MIASDRSGERRESRRHCDAHMLNFVACFPFCKYVSVSMHCDQIYCAPIVASVVILKSPEPRSNEKKSFDHACI